MKYDIFISYKRKGTSSATAAYLYELLQQKGYNVFFDRKEMRSGKFNEQILEHISNATDILILLEEESLGSWFNNRSLKINKTVGNSGSSGREMSIGAQEEPYKSDWFCKEIMYALGLKDKHIIPILLNGYRMPEEKDLPPEMKELCSYHALPLEISEMDEFYEKYFVEQGNLHSKPANLSLSQRYQSKGGIVGCFLFYTDADSCDLYECGEKILTLTDNNDEKHPFRYPVNFAGEHRFWAYNNDSCEEVMIKCSVETNCQQYVQVQFSEDRDLWALSTDEINAQDDAELLYNWGVGLFDGTTKHEPDITLSFECFNRAINLGSEKALLFVCNNVGGLVTSKKASDEIALKWNQIAAEQDIIEAQGNLGYMYLFGKGVAQDYGKAFEWLLKGAMKDEPRSQCLLGNMFEDGLGVEQDYGKALEWYKKAAEQGEVCGQCLTGDLYYAGHGVDQDYTMALEWYLKSAEQGDEYAQQRVGYMYEEGLGVEQDYSKAAEWYLKSAEQSNAEAQFCLGTLFDEGLGVEQDYGQAFEWYKKAAEQGDAGAQFSLGNLFDEGLGVEQDYRKALEWYQKSAEQGNMSAQYFLGDMYHNGRGVEQDYGKAFEWLMKAAEQEHANAMFYVGYSYSFGEGVEQDFEKALSWLKKSVERGNEVALSTIAITYAMKEEYVEALLWAKKAVNASPNDPVYNEVLAEVYNSLCRYKEALKQFERCLQLYEEEGNEDGIKVTEEKISALKKMMKVRK